MLAVSNLKNIIDLSESALESAVESTSVASQAPARKKYARKKLLAIEG